MILRGRQIRLRNSIGLGWSRGLRAKALCGDHQHDQQHHRRSPLVIQNHLRIKVGSHDMRKVYFPMTNLEMDDSQTTWTFLSSRSGFPRETALLVVVKIV